jgi:hypothetical protein
MPTLRARLDDLSRSFADAVLTAIRSASLDELLEGGGRSPARAARGQKQGAIDGPAVSRSHGSRRRRSSADIEAQLARVVAVVRQSTGMRSEEIQRAVGLNVGELLRVLHRGLAKKVLKRRGVKRATTYSAV